MDGHTLWVNHLGFNKLIPTDGAWFTVRSAERGYLLPAHTVLELIIREVKKRESESDGPVD